MSSTNMNGIPNGSEFQVPNGSEVRAGRPALVSDEGLIDLTRQLTAKLGRPPRADELITESGGCQRTRALNAIRTFKLEGARQAVNAQLVFPAEVESSLRQLMTRWQDLSAAQLAESHLHLTEQFESRESAQRAIVDELQAAATLLSDQLKSRDSRILRLVEKLERLELDYAALKEQHIEIRSLASERLRLIRQWQRNTHSSQEPKS